MTVREWMLAGLLAVAAAMTVRGLFEIHRSVGWIGAGVLSAAWCWFVLAEDGRGDVDS